MRQLMKIKLQNFHHDGYQKHKTLWQLTQVPTLEEFVYVVDESRRLMVEDIITKFQTRVLDHLDEFPQQIIHGDFNEQNILVNKIPPSKDYKVFGFIDFGDTQHSCLLFEIAIALTYIMYLTAEIETGGYFLAGYRMTRLIPENEMNVLRVRKENKKIILSVLMSILMTSFL
jgi:hydroxylysine kinase